MKQPKKAQVDFWPDGPFLIGFGFDIFCRPQQAGAALRRGRACSASSSCVELTQFGFGDPHLPAGVRPFIDK